MDKRTKQIIDEIKRVDKNEAIQGLIKDIERTERNIKIGTAFTYLCLFMMVLDLFIYMPLGRAITEWLINGRFF